MAARPLPAPEDPDPSSRLRVFFLSLTISASLLLLVALLFLLFYLYFSLFRRSRTLPFDSPDPLKLHKFSYKEIKSATHAFSSANFIGKGGSGSIYRGILTDGKSVAVKKIDPSSSQPGREFRNETQILGGIRSPFIVSLLGYCVEKQRRFLVYEYMPNRSLQEALFAEEDGPPLLRWANRFEIILDVARGLHFLHLECDPPVVHGDIKPSNVLLSVDFRAKISDFGLSRVKMEGELGIDFFSQELGRSQELWKSQELSGNLAASLDNNEVGFGHALHPTSSSSKNNNNANDNNNGYKVDCNGKSSGCKNNSSSKGKEVTNYFGGEDVFKFGAYDDEFCSVEHSNELNLNPLSPSADDPTTNSKKWGRDWWWKQDASGELSSRDYVMEWIGSQICPSSNPDWDDDLKLDIAAAKPDLANSVETSIVLDEAQFGAPTKKKDPKAGTAALNKCGKSNRKMKEWWKEEYFAEMSSKRGERKQRSKPEGRWKRGFRTLRFDVGQRFQLRKAGGRKEETKHQTGLNANSISFTRGWKKKKKKKKLSVNSEALSGDLFSRELSSTTSMRGTICYVAPEYGGCGYLMEKADIYSFGVLILVVVSGRRPLHVLSSPMKLEQANLISWCRNLAQRGNVLDLVDERLKDEFNKDQVCLCINLALMCLQKMPELRPDAGDIVKILKGEMDLPSLPLEYSPSPPSKLFSRSRRRAAEAE